MLAQFWLIQRPRRLLSKMNNGVGMLIPSSHQDVKRKNLTRVRERH